MATPDDLRVSDEQRDRAAQEIREHYAAGRLTDDELSDRIQAAYSARTAGELKALTADLPKLPATRAQQKAEIAQRRRDLQRRLLQEAGGGSGAFLICTVIWLASGASGFFWPIFVALGVLIPLVRNGWRLYGPAPEFDVIERELESRRRRDEVRKEVRGQAHDRAARRSRRHDGG
ncbi:MAG TPA: DUF1707 domain-containing protein [Solirubrobacteraceae bacterium]|nr:DUF1707 domain-containing protein [Solirubrobacteraceae bacterium]